MEPGGVDADRVTETWWLIGGLGGRPDPNLFSRKEMSLHLFFFFFFFNRSSVTCLFLMTINSKQMLREMEQ